jgi:hypothetical protein
MRCSHCPAPDGATCRGVDVPHLCTLVDPSSSSYRPEYLRILVADDHVVTDAERAAMAQKAEYPPLLEQIGNLWRSLMLFARSGGKLAPKTVRRARLAICMECPQFDTAKKRCRKCGCAQSAKVFIAADQCPLDPPKWRAV